MRKLQYFVFIQILFTAKAFFLFNVEYHSTQGQGILTRIFGNKRLEFVFDKFLNWDDASYECHNKGGYLVKIPDYQTQEFIMSTLQSLYYSEQSIWIGLNDKVREGSWKWDNGDFLHGYTNFGQDENNHGFLHLGTDCICIELDDFGTWHDKPCHGFFKFNFICEYNDVTSQTVLPRTTTPAITTTTTTSSGPTSQPQCPPYDCAKTCMNGYSGLYINSNGCISCTCL